MGGKTFDVNTDNLDMLIGEIGVKGVEKIVEELNKTNDVTTLREDPRLFQQTVDEYNMVHWQPVSEEAYKLYICDLADKIKGEKKMDTYNDGVGKMMEVMLEGKERAKKRNAEWEKKHPKSNLQDSGNRREFETGAVRDIDETKGRCDLLPLRAVGMVLNDYVLCRVDEFMKYGEPGYLCEAIEEFTKLYFNDSLPEAILEVSIHYKDGAKKYEERNWEKGIPLHSFIDSGVRHYLKHLRGDNDERHDRAFIWNMLGAIWTLQNKPELDDIPHLNCTTCCKE